MEDKTREEVKQEFMDKIRNKMLTTLKMIYEMYEMEVAIGKHYGMERSELLADFAKKMERAGLEKGLQKKMLSSFKEYLDVKQY